MQIPEKNPDAGKPIKPAKVASKTHVEGAALTPNEATLQTSIVRRAYKYWVGVTPSCPRESLDMAGINFPKVNESIIDDPTRSGEKRRVPVVGAIVTLTEDQVQKLRDQLPRSVIRFTDDPGEREEPGTGENIGDAHRRPRKGHPIRIPTFDERAARRAAGRPDRAYVPSKNDVPTARFMFAQLCEDQERGNRGEWYPPPLEETGLSWPDEIEGDPSPKRRRKTTAKAPADESVGDLMN